MAGNPKGPPGDGPVLEGHAPAWPVMTWWLKVTHNTRLYRYLHYADYNFDLNFRGFFYSACDIR